MASIVNEGIAQGAGKVIGDLTGKVTADLTDDLSLRFISDR